MAWIQRLWNVVRPNRLHDDIARELAFHVEERADQLREEGLSADEAHTGIRPTFTAVGAGGGPSGAFGHAAGRRWSPPPKLS